MNILRISAQWSGFPGAPGYSNFFFSTDPGFFDGGIFGDSAEAAATNAGNAVRNAFFEITSNLPEGVRVSIMPEAVVIDSDTGEQLGFIDIETQALGAGSGSGGFSGPSGAVVNWRTNDYRAGRRIRGRTFLVPLAGSSYEADGTLTSSARGNLQDFGAAMIGGLGGSEFGVWSRPVNGSGGVFATVVSSNVPDMAAVLRSRRD